MQHATELVWGRVLGVLSGRRFEARIPRGCPVAPGCWGQPPTAYVTSEDPSPGPLPSVAWPPAGFRASLGISPGPLNAGVTDGGFLTRVPTCASCACWCVFQASALEFSLWSHQDENYFYFMNLPLGVVVLDLSGAWRWSGVPVGPGAGSPLSVVVTVEGPPACPCPLCPRPPCLPSSPTSCSVLRPHSALSGSLLLGVLLVPQVVRLPLWSAARHLAGGGGSGGLRTRSVGMCLASSDYAGWWAWGGSPHGGCALLARHTQGAHHPRGCQPRCVCWVSGRMLLFSSFHA